MTDKTKEQKERIANRKLVKELADFFYRVVQMWIVLALVVYFQRQSGSWLATTAMMVLTSSLLLYCYVSPINMVEEWEVSRGKEPPGLMLVGVLFVTLLVGMPLLFSDPIIDEINRITHASASSPATLQPHGS